MKKQAFKPSSLPCPFCGSTNIYYMENGLETDWVQCDDCHCTGPTSDGKTQAYSKWNLRIEASLNPIISEELQRFKDETIRDLDLIIRIGKKSSPTP